MTVNNPNAHLLAQTTTDDNNISNRLLLFYLYSQPAVHIESFSNIFYLPTAILFFSSSLSLSRLFISIRMNSFLLPSLHSFLLILYEMRFLLAFACKSTDKGRSQITIVSAAYCCLPVRLNSPCLFYVTWLLFSCCKSIRRRSVDADTKSYSSAAAPFISFRLHGQIICQSTRYTDGHFGTSYSKCSLIKLRRQPS